MDPKDAKEFLAVYAEVPAVATEDSTRLADVVKLLDDASKNRTSAANLRKFGLSVRIQGGEWVRFPVHLATFTLPVEDNVEGRRDLSRRIEQAIEANWSAILKNGPR